MIAPRRREESFALALAGIVVRANGDCTLRASDTVDAVDVADIIGVRGVTGGIVLHCVCEARAGCGVPIRRVKFHAATAIKCCVATTAAVAVLIANGVCGG